MAFLIHFDKIFEAGLPVVSDGTTTLSVPAGTLTQTEGVFYGGAFLGAASQFQATLPFTYGGDLTIEFRLKLSASATTQYVGIGNSVDGTPYVALEIAPTTLALSLVNNDDPAVDVSQSLVAQSYAAVALVITGNVLTLFVDGVANTNTLSLSDGASPVEHLTFSLDNAVIDELRVSDSALYTADYTVSTAPFAPADDSANRVHQVRATGINTTTADLADDFPPTYSEIGQVHAVGVSVDSEPQPQFASYLTQLRVIDLIGQLTDVPEAVTKLSQFKVQAIELGPIADTPLLFAVEKQVLEETEPADWVRVNSVRNLAVKQESVSGSSFIYSVHNKLGLQDEPPAPPPRKSLHTGESVSTVDAYLHPLAVRSYSRTPQMTGSVSLAMAMPPADSLQSYTNLLQSGTSVSSVTTMRDPSTLQAGSVAWQSQASVSTAELMEDPSNLRSPSRSLQAQTSISVQDQADDPAILRSSTRLPQVGSAYSTADTYPDPDDLRGSALLLQSQVSTSTSMALADPDDIHSQVRQSLIGASVSTYYQQEDPGVIQSDTNQLQVTTSFSTETELPDPATMSQTVLSLQGQASVSSKLLMDDPSALISSTLHLQVSESVSLPDHYVDPSWLYQYPAKQFHVSESISVPWVMDNPMGRKIPVVNVNYYWG